MVISLEAKFTSCLLGFMDYSEGWKKQGEVSGVGSWEWCYEPAHFRSFIYSFGIVVVEILNDSKFRGKDAIGT